jgi:hypothetical protein
VRAGSRPLLLLLLLAVEGRERFARSPTIK